MLQRLRQHLTIGNVAATMALLVATGGTSYAGVQLSGAQVKDNTLAGAQFAPGTINSAKLSPKMRSAFKGNTGSAGAAGQKGPEGQRGPTGDPGATGKAAPVYSSFASWDAGYIDTAYLGPNTGLGDWYAWNAAGGCVSPNCHLVGANAGNAIAPSSAAAGTKMIDLETTAPSGGGGENSGYVVASWTTSTVMAWANLTLMYRTEDDLAAIHTRVECWMEIDGAQAGPKTLVSAADQRELETIFLVGNLERGPGTYNAQARCRDADATAGRTRWQAVRANLVATASEKA